MKKLQENHNAKLRCVYTRDLNSSGQVKKNQLMSEQFEPDPTYGSLLKETSVGVCPRIESSIDKYFSNTLG